jgi:hypothetical protein
MPWIFLAAAWGTGTRESIEFLPFWGDSADQAAPLVASEVTDPAGGRNALHFQEAHDWVVGLVRPV